jgi:hypothetical protein
MIWFCNNIIIYIIQKSNNFVICKLQFQFLCLYLSTKKIEIYEKSFFYNFLSSFGII